MSSSKPIPIQKRNLSLPDLIAADAKAIADKINTPIEHLTHRTYIQNGGKYNAGILSQIGSFKSIIGIYNPPKQGLESTIVRLSDLRNNQRFISKQLGSKDIFLEELAHIMEKYPKYNAAKPYKLRKLHTKIERALVVLLSDLHFGTDLDPEEVGHMYGKVEEARIVAQIVQTICEYKMKYRDETVLYLNFLGDLIANFLHGISSAELLHLQTCRAMWLITQLISRVAEHFREIHVTCLIGNHDRDAFLHPGRATSQKYNALGTTIYYGAYLGTKHLPNIKWHQPKTAWCDMNILGHPMYGTHGDTNFQISNPGSTINTKVIENTINKINASRPKGLEYEVCFEGHNHIGLVTRLSNGVFFLTNGPGLPPDQFATTLNIHECPQNQLMFETTKEYAVGDVRFINLSSAMKDKSLDKIVQAWPGLVQ